MIKNKVVRLTKRPNGFPSKETWLNSIDEVREIEKNEILVKKLICFIRSCDERLAERI